MILRFYSIRDQLLEVYNNPFLARHDVEAMRNVKLALKGPGSENNQVAQNPGDYGLWYLGDFDDSTGVLKAASQPFLVSHVADLLQPRE